MPELRKDSIAGNWTIFSTERGWRPVEYKSKKIVEERACPFCEGHESETTAEIYAIRREGTAPNSPGWDVRAILSQLPILKDAEKPVDRYGEGIYDVMDAVGLHELIIESPKHTIDIDEFSVEAIVKVIEVYVSRLQDLDKEQKYKYALLFKNHGQTTGSARDIIRHARSQIIALPITPKRVKEELACAKRYFDYRNRCAFCDMIRQEEKEKVRLVAENSRFICFCPFASRNPFEIWILPKHHASDFGHLPGEHFPQLAVALKESLARLKMLLADPSYNMILHTAPFRHKKKEIYWKTIDEDYHWFLQISPRLTPSAGFEWGSGIYINPTLPEEAATLLREIPVKI